MKSRHWMEGELDGRRIEEGIESSIEVGRKREGGGFEVRFILIVMPWDFPRF
uniref:Uncharacterized protein n=1 Tax=Meloidogyne incognita TaxID=6306 RepID=A0A914KZ17_MELIC